jgi:glycosyltransferase involved in cell wall biosynthesis
MKITAIILTYNRPDALELILKSIQNQCVLPDEVIIADDGSGKETRDVIDKYRQNSSFRLDHVWQEDQGFRIAAIRNKAILKSNGDYLVFSDGDLVFHPMFFKDYKQRIANKTALIGSRVFLTGDASRYLLKQGGSLIKVHFLSKWIEMNRMNAIRLTFLGRLFRSLRHPGKMRGGLLGVWKSDIVAVNGWDESFSGWGLEDTELVTRLFYMGVSIRKLKFGGITYHLWHQVSDRDQVNENRDILENTVINRLTWCSNGLIKGDNS